MEPDINEIIEHLNNKTGRHFRASTKDYQVLLKRLFFFEYTIDDIKAVIDFKVKEWSGIEKMKPFLRPITLFDLQNFKRYLKQIKNI